jgi:hypothetical protein
MRSAQGLYIPGQNFDMNLPVYNDNVPGYGNYRRLYALLNFLDTPFDQIYTDPVGPQASFLKLSQTPQIFFSTIDATLQSFNIDLNHVRALQAADNQQELFNLVTPVYHALITINGYREYPDLLI